MGVGLPRTIDDWLTENCDLCPFEVMDTGSIEDRSDVIQIDFANEYIGGGVMYMGCLQVQIP